MTITALPTPPSRQDPTSFAAQGDAFLASLPVFVEEVNALAVAMNLNSTTDASGTSNAISLGAKTFTVTAGKSFQPGMYLVIADATAPSTNSMWGQITSYVGTTLVVNVVAALGSGTKTAWVISQSAPGSVGLADAQTLSNKKLDATCNAAFSFRNLLINADFRINQRTYASAATLATGVYGHDRWKAGASGGDYSFTQLAHSTQITIASGKSLIQVVEDKNVAGGSYILSWTGTAQARVGLNSATPSGSYAASPVLIAGQTAGTTMSVEFNTGTLGKVQLEAGTIATAFEDRHIGIELDLCKRYCPVIKPSAANGTVGTGQCTGTTSAQIFVPFTVAPRVAPTSLTVSAFSDWYITNAAYASFAASNITIGYTDVTGANVGFVVSGSMVAGNATVMAASNTNARIIFNGCEL